MLFSHRRRSRAFTLIELLVVIAIISILSSVVLANLGSARQKGRDGKRVSDIKQIQLALELYYDNNSQYPTSVPVGSGWSNLTTALNGTYISQTPNDPVSGNSYGYYARTTSGAGCDNTTPATKCTQYFLGAIMESTGQTGVLASDNDIDTGVSTVLVNGAWYSCNENAGGADERLFCTSSL
jgi:prepilin-type N-terminal cleavage/methylation domain-containing protein